MKIKSFYAVLISFFLFCSFSAQAGMDKTNMAWDTDSKAVINKIKSNPEAMKLINVLNEKMEESYMQGNRTQFYYLATDMWDELEKISKKHNGPSINKPNWLP